MYFSPFSKYISPSILAFLLSFVILALTLTMFYSGELGSMSSSCVVPVSNNQALSTSSSHTTKPDFRLLIGIITLPKLYERRYLLRTIYSLQRYNHATAHIDIHFVFCNLTSEEQKVFIALEIMQFDDIIILNCTENMDDGKTYKFLSSMPKLFGDQRYDYVMKVDDDAYLRLDSLVESLKNKSRVDMYFGLAMPCDSENFFPFPSFMSGMGYVLSWDLIEWMTESDFRNDDTAGGPEDIWTGRLLNMAGKGKNRYDNAPRMYDYKGPSPSNCFRHEYIPDTIMVHQLKYNNRWVETLQYFNVTSGLKPSKFYHIS
ncbi:hypothetical protein LUZ60_001997 [Juncus effusus]|nr:hypothetical protein LUZ60_001997 [Juncus effusus]